MHNLISKTHWGLRHIGQFLLLAIFFTSAKCHTDDLPPRILVFSKTAAYRHASIPAGVAALRRLCQENGMLMDSTENADDFNEKNLCRYAAVVFLSTTGDVLNPDQEVAFERYIQAGGGFVGIHSATDTEYGWGWYGELVGAYFVNHPAIQEGTIDVKTHDHPATKHLGDTWKRTGEWYNLRNLNPAVTVLLNADENSYQGGTMGANHPLSWYHDFDGGRAFYTAIGHTESSFSEPDFLKHILGGLQYAIGTNHRLRYDLCRTPELPDQSRFIKTVLVENLNEPMEFDMFPDGKILLIERRGAIKIFNPNTGLMTIAYKLPVHDGHEDGLLGLALDPNWADNHWIYLYYSPPEGNPRNRLARFRFVADTLDRASEQVLLEVPVQRDECCHAAGCIEFDAQGNLYLSTGDNTNPFASNGYDPIDERPGRSAWDAQRSAGNAMDLRGKILRIRPLPDGSYTCPPGNLSTTNWPGKGAVAPEIYIMGCRNPFRMSLDNRRGLLFWGEVGPDAGDPDSLRGPSGFDEVNRARTSGFFGWPYFVGDNQAYRDYDFNTEKSGAAFDVRKPINTSVNNTGSQYLPAAQPAMVWYPYGNSEIFPLVGNGSRNAMAGPVYYCDQYAAETRFPQHYDGKLIMYDWMRGWMQAVTLDSLGNFSRMEPLARHIQLSRPMDMLVDKSGALWLLEYGKQWFSSNPDARLSRIDYVRGNRPPNPVLLADKTAGAAPLSVVFSTAGTEDPEHDRLFYEINFDDGSPMQKIATNKKVLAATNPGFTSGRGTSLADSISHTFEKPGTYEVVLKVTDAQGASALARQTILVGNDPPLVFWDFNGKNRSFYEPGSTLHYQLQVLDREDGSLARGEIDAQTVTATIDYLETGFDITQIAQGHLAGRQQAEYARGKLLIDASDCSSCHAVDRQVNGPAYQAIARRYQKNEIAVRDLSLKVIRGGAGNWGQTVMSAHPQLSNSDVGEMIRWILSLGAPSKPVESVPLRGKYVLQLPQPGSKTKKTAPGNFVLQASYQDRGSRWQSALSAQETLVLRPAFQQAEQADSMTAEVRSFRPFKGDTVVLHEIRHNSFFMFKHCDLRGVYSVAIGLGSGLGAQKIGGGRVELHLDGPDGSLVGSAPVQAVHGEKTMEFTQITLPLAQSAWPVDRSFHDFYFVFKNENNPSKQVAVVDWVRFNL
ncbi:MAG: ThuA domain-containing protein [Lewinellaceae bacterium]|nr:ThuA domain-containing protein [Lewinellaceae bacterium]